MDSAASALEQSDTITDFSGGEDSLDISAIGHADGSEHLISVDTFSGQGTELELSAMSHQPTQYLSVDLPTTDQLTLLLLARDFLMLQLT